MKPSSASGALRPFSVDDPLPLGQAMLIEASAGTGKTYTLAALTIRSIAERDVKISRILLVTFTRMATAELRDRIRSGLVEAARHLAHPGPTDDALLQRLATGHPDELDLRRSRLEQAVRDFDTATISTIHGYCSQIRKSLGVLAPENIDAVPSESEAALIEEVCADLLFREVDGTPGVPGQAVPGHTVASLGELVAKARTLTGCDIQAASQRPEDLRTARLIQEAVHEVGNRLRRSGGLSYDSLLLSVRDILRSAPGQIRELRDQFDVVLVDEFQDTDPVQWEIFRTLFGPGEDDTSLILVGDPKQAVYSFRGGDVYTFLAAKDTAQPRALSVNQRSDPAVLRAMNALGEGQVFGEAGIAYQPVEPADRHRNRRFVDGTGQPAPGLVVRCVLTPEAIGQEKLEADAARRRIATDLAEVAADLIANGRIDDPDNAKGNHTQAVTAGKIAVLVGSTADAAPIAEALRKKGVPAVLRLKDNVANSAAAAQWRTLLFALDRPASTTRATAAALTWFFGWSPQQVAEAIDAAAVEPDPDVDPTDPTDTANPAHALLALQHQLGQWSTLLATKGMAALLGEARRSHQMVPRLLGGELGERNLTDLEHLAELVHSEARNRGRGVTAATAMAILDSLTSSAEDEVAADAVQRRIESDAEAVQIMTIHGSKGLQFPFVLLPTLWAGGKRVQVTKPLTYYDREHGQRVLDVSTPGTNDKTGKALKLEQTAPDAYGESRRQNCGDQHRLTYVALTRAVHQSIVWWFPKGAGTNLTGVARLLFGAGPDQAADAPVTLPAEHRDTLEQLRERVAGLGAADAIRIDEVGPRSATPALAPDAPAPAAAPLRVATFDRTLPRTAGYWSFTGLKGQLHADHPAQGTPDPTQEFAEDQGAADEDATLPPAGTPGDLGEAPPSAQAGWQRPSLFEGLGGGKEFGNLVHHLFEVVDFRSVDLEQEFDRALGGAGSFAVTDAQRRALPGVLAKVAQTPLGPRFGGISLADLTAGDRLSELQFYLPLAPDRPVSARHIGAVVHDLLDPGDPLRPWAARLARGLARVDLQGYLNGSIDLTLRYPADGGTRYSVIDYKTNNLTPRGAAALLGRYHPDRLAPAMAESHYALQAIIYTVALHRYLRWRLAGYSPAAHLGPVGYLYVRGMVGIDTPPAPSGPNAGTPAGLFTWTLPPPLVEAVSDLFAGDDDLGRRADSVHPPTGGPR